MLRSSSTTSTRRSCSGMHLLQRADVLRSREPDSKRRAPIFAAARRPDPAALPLHEGPTDVQPQAHARQAPTGRIRGAPERLEDRLQVLTGQADAGVANLDQRAALAAVQQEPDLATGRRVLDGVAQK